MEFVRIMNMPACKMVSSGVGFFGDEKFNRFEAFLHVQPKSFFPQDFLTGRDGGMEWLYFFREGMDTMGMDVVDFPGGIYAVVCGIDGESNSEEMAAVEEFLINHNFEHDHSRPQGGAVIGGDKKITAALGYEQMDYYIPIKIKEVL